jgi:hypothetical protein
MPPSIAIADQLPVRQCFLGLDISTSVVGITALDPLNPDALPFVFDTIILKPNKKNKLGDEATLFTKATYFKQEFDKLMRDYKLQPTKIFVEENAKSFKQGASSADVILTLAKFNGIVSYITMTTDSYVQPVALIDVNVTSARSKLGFKNPNPKDKSKTIKEKVFDYVTAKHPEFPWRKHIAKTGHSQGQEVYDSDMYDACDSYVIVRGGMKIHI